MLCCGESDLPSISRTARHLSLSEADAAFHTHCAQLFDLAQTAEAAVSQFHQSPRGQLRVSAPVAFSNGSLAPLLPGFLARDPEVQLELFALYLPNRYLPPKVRVFIDYLVDCFEQP